MTPGRKSVVITLKCGTEQRRGKVVISPDLMPYTHCQHLNTNHLTRGTGKGGQAAQRNEPNERCCSTDRKSRRQTTVISQGPCGIDNGAAGPRLYKLHRCVTGKMQ